MNVSMGTKMEPDIEHRVHSVTDYRLLHENRLGLDVGDRRTFNFEGGKTLDVYHLRSGVVVVFHTPYGRFRDKPYWTDIHITGRQPALGELEKDLFAGTEFGPNKLE